MHRTYCWGNPLVLPVGPRVLCRAWGMHKNLQHGMKGIYFKHIYKCKALRGLCVPNRRRDDERGLAAQLSTCETSDACKTFGEY